MGEWVLVPYGKGEVSRLCWTVEQTKRFLAVMDGVGYPMACLETDPKTTGQWFGGRLPLLYVLGRPGERVGHLLVWDLPRSHVTDPSENYVALYLFRVEGVEDLFERNREGHHVSFRYRGEDSALSRSKEYVALVFMPGPDMAYLDISLGSDEPGLLDLLAPWIGQDRRQCELAFETGWELACLLVGYAIRTWRHGPRP